MTEFTPARLAELKAVAEAATAGPWRESGSLFQVAETGSGIGQVWGLNWRSDLAHIAAFDPPTVLALIAALEAKTVEVEELRAWQAQTVRRVRDTVASEHLAMLVVEDIPNADYGELIDTLVEQRDEALAEVERWQALWNREDGYRIDSDRRAVRAEAAVERVREAATEVTNHGDNHGGTHYYTCWKQHLHCLAAKIIHETGDDDE